MNQIDQMTQLPYCVYAHFVDDQMIYIGAGELRRAFDLQCRQDHHVEAMSHGNVKVAILQRFSNRDEALRVERTMIDGFRPMANVRKPGLAIKRPKNAVAKVKHERKEWMRAEAKAILHAVTRAAQDNEPCPTNAELACITGSRPSGVARILARLAGKGMIKVEIGVSSRVIHVGEHSTKPTKNFNMIGVATVEIGKRKVDWLIV